MHIVHAADYLRDSNIGQFEQVLVQVLWFTLDKRLEGASPLRVMFLVHHGGYAKQQPEPQITDDGLTPIVYHARSRFGYKDNDYYIYSIREGSPDEVFARRLLTHDAELKDGLLIEDVTQRGREACPLLPPGEDVMSYCRVAVRDPDTHYGILYVDGWEPGSLNKEDREVITAFATILAIGLTLGIRQQSQEDRQPSPSSANPSTAKELSDG